MASRVTDFYTDFGIYKISKVKINSNTRNIQFTFLAAIADLKDKRNGNKYFFSIEIQKCVYINVCQTHIFHDKFLI